MKIEKQDWDAASGSLVIDDMNRLWVIAGFIDSPAVILRGYNEPRDLAVEVLGSEASNRFRRLIPENDQVEDSSKDAGL